jgi:hypothetical protein
MRALLFPAAGLMLLLSAAHSYLGERYILIRLFRHADLPRLFGGTEFTKRTLRFAWHLTSVLALGFAALLVVLAAGTRDLSRAAAVVVSATFLLGGFVALIGSRGRHLSWVVLFAIAVLTWLGAR